MATTLESLREAPSLENLYPQLDELSINAGWAKPTPSLYPIPYENFHPSQWLWADGKAALDAAGRLIDTELAERRNLILFNPVEGNTYATVRTLIAAYQMILPGEQARSHRHTPNALRFILEGEGAYTVVDGQRLEMKPNDVLLTPNWRWHGHASEAEGACYWLDILDVPLCHLLEPMFFEPHPDNYEPIQATPAASDCHFPWDDIVAGLDRAVCDPSGRKARRVELGSPAMASTALYMQRLDSGEKTRAYRTSANQIVCCAEGTGETVIDGETFTWERGDVMAIPCWRPFSHRAGSDAVLFSATDEPVMRSLNWLREQDEE